MTQKPRRKGDFREEKNPKPFPGEQPPHPAISLRLRRSFRKSVSMFPRSTSGTCSSIAWEVGPSDAIPAIFRKSGTVSVNKPLEATASVGLWIHLGLLTEQTTRKKHLPKREGTSKSFRRFAYGKHGGGEVIFFYAEDPNLASHYNDHRTTLRFGRHRHVCICSYRW